jgi:hypothetical protein
VRCPTRIRDRAHAIKNRVWWPGLLVLGLGASAACARGEPLSEATLSAAKARWAARGLADYDVHLEIEGDLVQEGEFEVEVRGRQVRVVRRNGAAVETHDAFYSVDGMFGFLGEELEMAKEPVRYWSAPADARIFQRARFDEDSGRLRRYVRAVSGTKHNIVITVDQVTPVAAP